MQKKLFSNKYVNLERWMRQDSNRACRSLPFGSQKFTTFSGTSACSENLALFRLPTPQAGLKRIQIRAPIDRKVSQMP